MGASQEGKNMPYVLSGPVDTWGGTWPAAGWRVNEVNLLFTVDELKDSGDCRLVIELADHAKEFLPLVKVDVNGHPERIVSIENAARNLETELSRPFQWDFDAVPTPS